MITVPPRASCGACLLLAALGLVALAWAPLFLNRATLLASHDARERFYPAWVYDVTEIQSGRLPIWDSSTNAGTLYPPFMLLAFLGGPCALTATFEAHAREWETVYAELIGPTT